MKDLLSEAVVLNPNNKNLILKAGRAAMLFAVLGILITLGTLIANFNSELPDEMSLDAKFLFMEGIIFLLFNFFLILATIDLRKAITRQRNQLVNALKHFEVSIYLLIPLLGLALSYHVIWKTIKMYLIDGKG